MPLQDMLINYVPGEECRIAVVAQGRLEEFYQERASAESHVGSIYKGRVSNVEPSIQAAFVDFGLERNGFLHISDLHPMYFPGDHKEEVETVGLKTPRRERPPIQRCLRRGQEILVQVLKEGIGTKGPTLTSYLSIPGRYLVMMPYMERLGVSRKIEDDDARRQSRRILQELNPPEGFGFIIRTAGIGKPKTELKRDLAYLVRLWKTLEKRMNSVGQIGELYTESDLLIRTLRDVFTSDIGRIIVDDASAAHRAHDFLSVVSPRSGSQVYLYKDAVPLFHRFDIERQIETINARTVPLPSGGSLVIDQAEAMVAIDVNSGKSRDNRDAEMTAYKTDLEACDEICRQLKLRDLGGVIVIDMIDMHQAKHRRDVETRFRNHLKKDRARTQVLPISRFGILEMTRQRMRPSLTKSTFTPCPHCQGQGHVKTPETVVLEVSRRLAMAMQRGEVARIELTVSPDVAFQLLNRKRAQLVAMEQRFGKPVMVRVSGGGGIDFIDIACFDARGGTVVSDPSSQLPAPELEQIQGGMELAGESDIESESPGAKPMEARHAPSHGPAQATEQAPSAPAIPVCFPPDSEKDAEDVAIAPPSRPQGFTRSAPVPGGKEGGMGKSRRRRRSRGGRNQGAGREEVVASPDALTASLAPKPSAAMDRAAKLPAMADQTSPRITSTTSVSAPLVVAVESVPVPVSSTLTATTGIVSDSASGGHAPKPVAGGWRRKRGSQGNSLLYPRLQPGAHSHVSVIQPKSPQTAVPLAAPASSAPPARLEQGASGRAPRQVNPPQPTPQTQGRPSAPQEQRSSSSQGRAISPPQRQNPSRSGQQVSSPPRPQPPRANPPVSQNRLAQGAGNPSRGYKNAVVAKPDPGQPA